MPFKNVKMTERDEIWIDSRALKNPTKGYDDEIASMNGMNMTCDRKRKLFLVNIGTDIPDTKPEENTLFYFYFIADPDLLLCFNASRQWKKNHITWMIDRVDVLKNNGQTHEYDMMDLLGEAMATYGECGAPPAKKRADKSIVAVADFSQTRIVFMNEREVALL